VSPSRISTKTNDARAMSRVMRRVIVSHVRVLAAVPCPLNSYLPLFAPPEAKNKIGAPRKMSDKSAFWEIGGPMMSSGTRSALGLRPMVHDA